MLLLRASLYDKISDAITMLVTNVVFCAHSPCHNDTKTRLDKLPNECKRLVAVIVLLVSQETISRTQ
jgi:hypothetical protein